MPYREIFSKSRRLEDGLLCLNPVLSKFWERYAGFPWDLLGVQATPHKQSYTKSRFVLRNQGFFPFLKGDMKGGDPLESLNKIIIRF